MKSTDQLPYRVCLQFYEQSSHFLSALLKNIITRSQHRLHSFIDHLIEKYSCLWPTSPQEIAPPLVKRSQSFPRVLDLLHLVRVCFTLLWIGSCPPVIQIEALHMMGPRSRLPSMLFGFSEDSSPSFLLHHLRPYHI